jgi:hypothetical protein
MSLINDALKRARDAERNRPTSAPQPPLAPVDTPPRQHPATRWILLILVVIAISLSSLSFWKWAHHESATTLTQSSSIDSDPAPVPDPALSQEEPFPLLESPAPGPPPPALVLPEDLEDPAVITNPPSTNLVPPVVESGLAAPEDDSAAIPIPAPSESTPIAVEPELRLQSIIYRLRNPAVVINGQMLSVGDAIAGGNVTDIQRNSVTVQRGESNIVLQLPRF